MIKYHTGQGGCSFFRQLCQRAGSVFPAACKVALPCASLTAALTVWIQYGDLQFLENGDSVLRDNAAWGGFSFLVGFLIVFRTSQSYNRFWDGCTSTHHMRAEWFDGCSSLLAFCKHSQAGVPLVSGFQNTLVRLFSMLHAAALAEIEDCCEEGSEDREAFGYPLIDADGIDEASLLVVKASSAKVELIFQWIQQLIIENISTGVLSIPPPILSRSFQEIANGMVAFHDAMKISYIPFPFPYAQTCDFLLLLHWIIVPFVVCQWVTEPVWAAVFSFIQVFILWALNFIAEELENPFGQDANDIDGWHMQEEMNEHLLLLMSPTTRTTPKLTSKFTDLTQISFCHQTQRKQSLAWFAEKSFSRVWNDLALVSEDEPEEVRSLLSSMPVCRRSTAVRTRPSTSTTARGMKTSVPRHSITSNPEEATEESSDQKPRFSTADPETPPGTARLLVETSTPDADREEVLPSEPAPLQLQNVQVLENAMADMKVNGESFSARQEGLMWEVAAGFSIDRPPVAPQSTRFREDDNASLIDSSRSTVELHHSAANNLPGAYGKAERQSPSLRGDLPSYSLVHDETDFHVAQQPRTSGSTPVH